MKRACLRLFAAMLCIGAMGTGAARAALVDLTFQVTDDSALSVLFPSDPAVTFTVTAITGGWDIAMSSGIMLSFLAPDRTLTWVDPANPGASQVLTDISPTDWQLLVDQTGTPSMLRNDAADQVGLDINNGNTVFVQVDSVQTPVPEPASLSLLATGTILFTALRWGRVRRG